MKRQKGFTLLEVMWGIAILSVIVGAISLGIRDSSDKSRAKYSSRFVLTELNRALDDYYGLKISGSDDACLDLDVSFVDLVNSKFLDADLLENSKIESVDLKYFKRTIEPKYITSKQIEFEFTDEPATTNFAAKAPIAYSSLKGRELTYIQTILQDRHLSPVAGMYKASPYGCWEQAF